TRLGRLFGALLGADLLEAVLAARQARGRVQPAPQRAQRRRHAPAARSSHGLPVRALDLDLDPLFAPRWTQPANARVERGALLRRATRHRQARQRDPAWLT